MFKCCTNEAEFPLHAVFSSRETFDPEDEYREGAMKLFGPIATRSLVYCLMFSSWSPRHDAQRRNTAEKAVRMQMDARPHTCKYLCLGSRAPCLCGGGGGGGGGCRVLNPQFSTRGFKLMSE